MTTADETRCDLQPDEIATILAALRFYVSKGQAEPCNRSDAIHQIATAADELVSLDADAIDRLCERLNLETTDRDHARTLRLMMDDGLSFGDVLDAFAVRQREREPDLMPYAEAVESVLSHADGDFSTDATPIVSKGDEDGAYVLVWRWVRDDEAGLDPGDDNENEADD